MALTTSPLLQSQKLRDVFNMDFPDNNFLMKTLTVVSGPDMVDLTFHNFVSYKENVGKVHGDTGTPGLGLGTWESLAFLTDRPGPRVWGGCGHL